MFESEHRGPFVVGGPSISGFLAEPSRRTPWVSAVTDTFGDMTIARHPSFVYDCPDAGALASFYGTLLGWEVKEDDGGWAEIRSDDGSSTICFQQVADYRAPRWPGQEVPQQVHLDVMVPDLDAAEAEVLGIGASRAEHQPGTTFRVFLDPAGHPFCLCVS